MVNNITIIDNFRIKFSSYSNIYNISNNKFNNIFNNNKIVNINNFRLQLENKIINYSLIYTNPYLIEKKYLKNIIYIKSINLNIINICKKIFINKNEINNFEKKYIFLIIKNKNKYNNFLELEKSFLILWYLVKYDKYINDKEIYYDLIINYYKKYLSNKFNILEIVCNVFNTDNLFNKKFFISLYLLAEEFHYKYIKNYLEKINKNIILNSNYIKLNPQEILNDCLNNFIYNNEDLDENINIPNAHNILLIISSNKKVFYYDPDEQNLYDIHIFKRIFLNSQFLFFNISNKNPIQTINDDGNCIYYCLYFFNYLFYNNININFNNLKISVLRYEKKLQIENNIFWINNLINNY